MNSAATPREVTLELDLDEESQRIIEKMIATGRYATPSEVVCAALELLAEQKGWRLGAA